MTHIDTSPACQIKLILETMQDALTTLELICDYVYTSDAPGNYSIVPASHAEEIHLEAAGMLVPLETALAALRPYANPSNDRLDPVTKKVAE